MSSHSASEQKVAAMTMATTKNPMEVSQPRSSGRKSVGAKSFQDIKTNTKVRKSVTLRFS